jgi:hypothetical protein
MADPETNAPDVIGTWQITGMEMWDEEYFNTEVQAYIRIREGGTGDFQFGLVSGSIDGHVEQIGSDSRFTFTWEGRDVMDPVSGSGWLRPVGDGEAEGMIKFYMGDRSRLSAQRAS